MALNSTIGDANAESYVSVADFKARCDAVGYDYTTPAYTDAAIEEALRRGTEWLEGKYLRLWPGFPVDVDQALHWPAYNAWNLYGVDIDPATIPTGVIRATVEAAWREVQFPNSLTPDFVRKQQLIRKKTGPLEKEYSEPTGPADLEPFLTAVRNHLAKIVDPNALNANTSQGPLTGQRSR